MCDLPRPLSGEGSHPLAWLVELLPVKRKLSKGSPILCPYSGGCYQIPKRRPPGGGGGYLRCSRSDLMLCAGNCPPPGPSETDPGVRPPIYPDIQKGRISMKVEE